MSSRMSRIAAVAMVVIAGGMGAGVAGNAVGSAPMLPTSTIARLYPQHDVAAPVLAGNIPPPDQYPLVTPDRIIPVTGLALRGLYSQARYLAPADLYYDGAGGDPGEPPATAAAAAEPPRQVAGGEAAAATGVQEPGAGAVASAEPARESAGGMARTIDVAAALAMR